MLLAIGGQDQRGYKTSAIYGFHRDADQKWRHVGDMPLACYNVDALLLSGGGLMVVDGGITRQVLNITVEGKYCCTVIELIELIRLFLGQ